MRNPSWLFIEGHSEQYSISAPLSNLPISVKESSFHRSFGRKLAREGAAFPGLLLGQWQVEIT